MQDERITNGGLMNWLEERVRLGHALILILVMIGSGALFAFNEHSTLGALSARQPMVERWLYRQDTRQKALMSNPGRRWTEADIDLMDQRADREYDRTHAQDEWR